MIDFTPLRRAVAQLESALGYAGSDMARDDAELGRHLRAGAIQAFEFTYELSIKMLRRALIDASPTPFSVGDLDFGGLIRAGYDAGLLHEEIDAWRAFRQARSITSHTYDEERAQEVFAGIPGFLAETHHLLHQLDARQQAG